MPVLHILGNHCFYNLTRPELNDRLGIHAWTREHTDVIAAPLPATSTTEKAEKPEKPEKAHPHSYYSVCPVPGWRVVVVDAYDVSLLGWADGHPHHTLAADILNRENINEVRCWRAQCVASVGCCLCDQLLWVCNVLHWCIQEKNSPEGMVGVQRRFVKFGGGVGSVQLQWLANQLAAAHEAGEMVVVAGHLPFHPDTAPRTPDGHTCLLPFT